MEFAKSALKILAAVLLIALAAQLTWSFSLAGHHIPVTGQSLAVLIVAFFLTPVEAFIALLLYITLGVFGFPVFAEGNSGWSVIEGKSGGYIYGFLIAAVCIAYLNRKYSIHRFSDILGLTTLGTFIILWIGAFHLATHIGMKNSIMYGVIPFWQGAVIKILLGSVLVWAGKKAEKNL